MTMRRKDISALEEVMMKEGKELNKQECKGVSGYMGVVLRGDSVGVTEGGCSYKMTQVSVCSIGGVKFWEGVAVA